MPGPLQHPPHAQPSPVRCSSGACSCSPSCRAFLPLLAWGADGEVTGGLTGVWAAKGSPGIVGMGFSATSTAAPAAVAPAAAAPAAAAPAAAAPAAQEDVRQHSPRLCHSGQDSEELCRRRIIAATRQRGPAMAMARLQGCKGRQERGLIRHQVCMPALLQASLPPPAPGALVTPCPSCLQHAPIRPSLPRTW